MFAALGYPAFRPFLVALVASGIGTWMQMFALGWLVVQLAARQGNPQDAPVFLGLVGLARAVPALSLGLVGGAVADRLPRRSILMVTQTAAACVSLLLATLIAIDHVTLWATLSLAAASSAIWAFDIPTRQSLLPSLVAERDLMSAVGLTAAASNATQILGPVLGGVVIVATSLADVFSVVALAFGFCVVLLLRVPTNAAVGGPRHSMARSVIEGLIFIRSNARIRWVLSLGAVVALLAWPYIFLLPAVALNDLHGDASTLSFLMAATGCGALVGSLSVANSGRILLRGWLLVSLEALVGLSLITFALQSQLVGALAAAFLIGAALVGFEGVANGVLQVAAPDRLRGRVLSARSLILTGVMPAGQLVLGAAASQVGSVDVVFLVSGAAVVLIAATFATQIRSAA